MNGQNGKLSGKQSAALPHLAAAASIEEGARSAGLSKVTVYNWLKESEFEAALRAYRRKLEEDAFNYLRNRMMAAAKVYDELLRCKDLAIKRLAAKDVLQFFGHREFEDIEARVSLLEERLKATLPWQQN